MTTALPDFFTGPGLLDLQVNGYGGFDFNSDPDRWTAEDLVQVRDGLARRGVMAALPTLITAPAERMNAAASRFAAMLEEEPELEATFPRLHIEGPFISADEGPRGAHAAAHCTTPAEMPQLLDQLLAASGGRIGILTLAPELPGALELIVRASEAGVCVALGHTNATPEILDAAAAAGARMCTHLGNGSHQLLPRLANYVQAQLADDRLMASFIADGHHMPWYTLRNFLRAKTLSRAILVSDSVAAADMEPGRYPLSDEFVELTPAGRVQRPGQPNLAGSALTLDRAVVNVVRFCGIGLEAAWAMASTVPAALLGLAASPAIRVAVTEAGFTCAAADADGRTSRLPTSPADRAQ